MMIQSKSGYQVAESILTPQHVLNRTTVLYGPSKTGKTVITKHILNMLQGEIDQVVLISPTEQSNRAYEEFIPAPLIHYKCDMPLLHHIMKRQEMLTSLYTKVNEISSLKALYARLPQKQQQEGGALLSQLKDKYMSALATSDKHNELTLSYHKVVSVLYKQMILVYIPYLWRERATLTLEEQYTLKYLQLNPRILVIFDDCAAEFKPFLKKDIFRQFFYQNRHNNITVVFCCQDDTDLPANLRKNVFMSIFTESVVCKSNFDRSSNNFPRSVKQMVDEIIPLVFKQHRKLVYIRDDTQCFYHLTCPLPLPQMFGSKALHRLCAKVVAQASSIDYTNPFFRRFQINNE